MQTSTPADRAPVALVTGARRGIGAGVARALAREGFDLVLLDLARDDEADSLLADIAQLGRRAVFQQADIGDLDARDRVADAAFGAFGVVDCLVNNAGVQVASRGDLLDVTPASFDRVLGINLRGTFFLTQSVARRMLAAPAPHPHPRSIVTITSMNAVVASPDRAEYCLSKTGLSMMTKQFALRLAPCGITVWEIRPGLIHTDMTAPVRAKYDALIAAGGSPIARWGQPDDVGRTVASLASGRIAFSTGEAVHVDGGMHIPR